MSDAIHWTTALESHAAYAEFSKVVGAHYETRRRHMETLQPGATSDQFQRLAGQIEALRWVLQLTNSQKPKPGAKT